MGNALVIKNADFSSHRVAVISFVETNPCTGVELEQTSISVTGDEAVTLAYTITPADTTDTVTWSSSDTSVATVSGNVVTILGIGSTTITVTCGSYSDSLTLTADLYESPDWYASSTFNIGTDNDGNNTVSMRTVDTTASGFNRIYAARDKNNSDYVYRPLDPNDYTADNGTRALKIPNNTERIHVTASNLYDTSSSYPGIIIVFTASTESVAYNNTYTVVKAISADSITVASNSADGEVTVPSGADSYYLGARLKTAGSAGDDLSEVVSNCNVSIHYLPAST